MVPIPLFKMKAHCTLNITEFLMIDHSTIFFSFLFIYFFCLSILWLTEIRKVLSKIGKEKESEAVNEWIRPCENHLHWSATSTFSGNGLVIWAKFKSFLRHMVNKHSDHSDPLFNKCAHGTNIPARKWCG